MQHFKWPDWEIYCSIQSFVIELRFPTIGNSGSKIDANKIPAKRGRFKLAKACQMKPFMSNVWKRGLTNPFMVSDKKKKEGKNYNDGQWKAYINFRGGWIMWISPVGGMGQRLAAY